jgi:multidrug efflux pump subunit AcrA (membrane-fusion protein)
VEQADLTPAVALATPEQALWRDLTGAPDTPRFGAAWLALLCRLVPGAAAGVLVLDGAAPTARWPDGSPPDPALLQVAQLAAEGRRGTVQQPADGPIRIAYPVLLEDRAHGAAAIEIAAAAAPDLRASMRQLQWATAWVRDHLRRRAAEAQAQALARNSLALDLLAAALEEPGFTAACRIATTELATRLGCERVSLGFCRRGTSVVAAISNSAAFGKRMNLIRLLGNAMDEAIDQNALILHPAPADTPLATRAHAALAAAHGSGQILTVPIFVKDAFVAAAVLERAADRPFDQPTVTLAEAVAAILGPALLDKREIDRWIGLKLVDAAGRQVARLLGPGHLGRKLAALALIALCVAGDLSHQTYRIAGQGRVEGAVQRAIVAPFDGFVREAPVKAGMVVQANQLMAGLDDRDLVLERMRWVTERQQHVVEYGEALSKEQRAEALRFLNLRDEAEAQIHLVDAQLSRARITAPFDGLVLSGDLSQSIGAPVRRGDTLFELAPLRDYRLELAIPEGQIADVAPGQHGEVVVAPLPAERFPFTVERITPVGLAQDGRMVFKVAARLDAVSDRLRPGMEGVGKIAAGRRRVVWIWFRSLIQWGRLAAWRFWP